MSFRKGETVLLYNGVKLRQCQTLSFTEEPVYDESGQTHLYNRIKLSVLGYFTDEKYGVTDVPPNPGDPVPYTIPSFGIAPHFGDSPSASHFGKGASQQYFLLHTYLMEKKKSLKYTFDGFNTSGDTTGESSAFILFDVSPAATDLENVDGLLNVDAKTDMCGGPKPTGCRITPVAGNATWRVEWDVEFCLTPPCYKNVSTDLPISLDPAVSLYSQFKDTDDIETTFDDDQRKLGILSNRWSCLDRLNEDGFLTRTYSGVVILANPNWNPHDYRSVTLPPLVPGMRRKSIEYRAAEDGLKLSYTIMDEEVVITPPLNSTDISISHTESIVELGATVNFSIRVALRGDKLTRMVELMQIAAAVIDSRLNLRQAVNANAHTVLIRQYDITTEQGSNQTNGLNLVVNGQRVKPDGQQGNPKAWLPGHLNEVSNSVFRRQGAVALSVLDSYNNQRAKGNRPLAGGGEEQPWYETVIPALSALHASIATRCTDNLETGASIDSQDEMDAREARQAALDATKTAYDVDTIYSRYPEVLIYVEESINDNPNLKYSDAQQTNIYTHYDIGSKYQSLNPGVQLPIAAKVSPDPIPATSVFVSIAQPVYRKVVTVQAQRVNAIPRLPEAPLTFTETAYGSASSGDPPVNCTLLSQDMVHLNPVLLPDGTGRMYTVTAEWVYAMDRAPAKFRLGVADYDSSAAPTGLSSAFSPEVASIYSAAWKLNA